MFHDFDYKYIFDTKYEILEEKLLNVSILCKIYKNNIAELYEIIIGDSVNPRQTLMAYCMCIRTIAEKLHERNCTQVIQLLNTNDFELIKNKTTWTKIDCHNCNIENCKYTDTVLVSCDINSLIDNIAIAMDLN